MTDHNYTWKQLEEVRGLLEKAIRSLHKPETAWEHIEGAWAQLNQLHENIDEGRIEMKPHLPRKDEQD